VIGRIGGDVSRELGRFGPASGMAPLVEAWQRAVGPDIARNAWPARIGRDGTLVVHVSSSPWAFELTHLEQRIRTSLGDVAPRAMKFVVGPLPEPSREVENAPPKAAPEPSPEHRDQAAQLAAQIGDEKLRKVVAKAAALSLAKADSDRSFW
jgi:hypothetical protein